MTCTYVYMYTREQAPDVCVSTQKRNDPNIATQAEAEVGSTAWSKAGNKHGWKDKWKCNAFVADMIEAAGHDYPERCRYY